MDKRGFGYPHQLIYRLPVAHFIMGNHQAAEEVLLDNINKLANRQDDAAREYRAFAVKLTKKIQDSNS